MNTFTIHLSDHTSITVKAEWYDITGGALTVMIGQPGIAVAYFKPETWLYVMRNDIIVEETAV